MLIIVKKTTKELYRGTTEAVILPSVKGEIQILNNHAPLFSLLTKGNIIIGNKVFHINSGIVEVRNNKVVVLVE